tara:strand:+ start:2550 stop:2696 length:147 start_codon:yes stop_codon:yes gene_type:complete
MGKKETNSYVLNDINPELWKQFRHKLLDDDLNIKEGLILLIERYVDGN